MKADTIDRQSIELGKLFYLGYALLLPAQQALLQDVVNGNINLDELKAGLNP